ncbi:gntR family transcriptional regulator [Salmonella enterica subsp. enterica]|nr:gntR family transcriptional regulator [Salmonella enterica subsp. enterica]
MEQAHTRLIAQLNERISAADNTPLYMKFAQTVKDAVRSGILEHGNILPGERDLSQLTGRSRIRYGKRCRRWKKRVSSRAPAATVRKSIISLNIP